MLAIVLIHTFNRTPVKEALKREVIWCSEGPVLVGPLMYMFFK